MGARGSNGGIERAGLRHHRAAEMTRFPVAIFLRESGRFRRMSNLKDYSRYVSDRLAEMGDSDAGQQLPVASRERLTEAKRLADQLSELLDRINAEVVSLEQMPNESVQATRMFWESLPAGLLREKSPQLRELRERSEMLTQLYRAGIDVVEIHKLSAKEIDISRRIGDAFGQFHRIWDRFKLAISKGESEIETRVEFSHEALRFFTVLRDTGVVSSFQTEWYTFSDKTWRDIPVAKLRASRSRAILSASISSSTPPIAD
jgi:hypothetical protein